MRITAYADRLIDDLDVLDWPESIKLIQRNWIGRSDGALIHFPVPSIGEPITVFTTRPDTMFGATYMVLAPEHPLVDELTPCDMARGHAPEAGRRGAATPFDAVAEYLRTAGSLTDVERQVESRQKTGVFTGAYATNPATSAVDPGVRRRLRADGLRHRGDHGGARPGRARLGVRRGVRAADRAHGAAARRLGRQGLRRRGPRDQQRLPRRARRRGREAQDHRVARAERLGEGTVTYRLRDWLFSRQRYWGEPFPILYDDTGLPIAVPESMLPVLLPELDDFSPRTFADDDETSMPEPPLARAHDWVEVSSTSVTAPRVYWRETNTMPQWAGSCWYELRYLDPDQRERVRRPRTSSVTGWDRKRPGDPGGVDLYVGGVEHAVLHLLYARFWHKVLFDLGHTSSFEPYRRLYNQGYILAAAYQDPRGMYVEAARGRRARRPLLPRRRRGDGARWGRWARA